MAKKRAAKKRVKRPIEQFEHTDESRVNNLPVGLVTPGRYAEVSGLYDALCEVVESKAIGPWFLAPNAAFGGLKPIEMIERGEIDRLWDMVYRLRSGVPG